MNKPYVYVIQIWPDFVASYLGVESDEDEHNSNPPRTLDYELAWKSENFVDARSHLRRVVKRYPEHSFRLNIGKVA
jgi:hypothetical protein